MKEETRRLFNQLEDLYQKASARLRSLNQERRMLEKDRHRLLAQLDQPAGNPRQNLHQALAALDRERDQIRNAEQKYRQEKQKQIDSLRDQIAAMESRRRVALSEQLQKSYAETERLRDDLIPQTRLYLKTLEERCRKTCSQSLHLANRLSRSSLEVPNLHRFDLAD